MDQTKLYVLMIHMGQTHTIYLTTALVVDEFGEGYPIAWCLSNRTDYSVMHHFLKAIQQNVCMDIKPSWLMQTMQNNFTRPGIRVWAWATKTPVHMAR